MSVGLLESHDPARGRVIVHPTPGASSPQAFAHDLLGALGRAVNRLDAEQLAGAAAGRAVTAWMMAGQIDDLWCCGRTGSRRAPGPGCSGWAGKPDRGAAGLPHPAGPRAPGRRPGRYRLPAHRAAASPAPRSKYPQVLPRPDGPAGAGPDAADVPRFLHPHIRNYRSKAFGSWTPSGWPGRCRLPARAGRGPSLAEHPPRAGHGAGQLPGRAAVPDLARARQSQPPSHAGPVRGAQARFRLRGLNLNIPPSQCLLDVLIGPGLDAPLVTAETAGRIRAGVAHR